MRDRIALPLIVLAAAAMIVLALVWPQGQGVRSPRPFGHPVTSAGKTVTVKGKTVQPTGAVQDVAEDALHDAQ